MNRKIRVIMGFCMIGFISGPAGALQFVEEPTEPPTTTADADARSNINVRAKGMITVTLRNIVGFDVRDVDVGSVRYGPDGAEEAHGKGHIEDSDQDGELDLVLHFKVKDIGVSCTTTELTLTGNINNGQSFSTSTPVNPKGC